jgi:signal transduction histidine kinase
MEALAPAAEAKGLAMTRELAVEVLPLEGDRRRVLQILLNLLSNAVKFTEAGTVTLRLTLEAGRARVAVQDTGPGIAAQDLPRLFREFEQLDVGLSRRNEGTGLGLALSRRLARLMDGDIGVESQPGHGSTFTLTLPLKECR